MNGSNNSDGSTILSFPPYIDNSILQNIRIAFNAGSLTDSIIMFTQDYLKIVNAEIFDFSKS